MPESKLQHTDYFIGCLTEPVPDAQSYFTPPDPPSNYKSPTAIAEYREREAEKFMARAGGQIVTGTLKSLVVLDPKGELVFGGESQSPGHASCELVKWLLAFDEYPVTVGSSFTPRRNLWGFDIDRTLRIVGLEALRHGSKHGLGHTPPLRLWHNNTGARDPYDVLVQGESERRTISLVTLCKYLGLSIDQGDLDPTTATADYRLAGIARLLCQRAGLVPYQ